jgi:hypothetical protein
MDPTVAGFLLGVPLNLGPRGTSAELSIGLPHSPQYRWVSCMAKPHWVQKSIGSSENCLCGSIVASPHNDPLSSRPRFTPCCTRNTPHAAEIRLKIHGHDSAARFYAATFPDSQETAVHDAPADYPGGKEGDVLTVEFTVLGIPCLGLNGGPAFRHGEAMMTPSHRSEVLAGRSVRIEDNLLS